MEMTLQRLGLKLPTLDKGLVMPIGILALAMTVLPPPVVLLDTFFVSNILVSLLVLMVQSTQRPQISRRPALCSSPRP